MRVTIEHEEIKVGMFRKKTYHEVQLTVHFSEEENQIIIDNELRETVILEREPQATVSGATEGLDDIFHLHIRQLLEGKTEKYALNTPLEAKEYAEKLTEHVKLLKQFLDENMDVGEKSTTFEL